MKDDFAKLLSLVEQMRSAQKEYELLPDEQYAKNQWLKVKIKKEAEVDSLIWQIRNPKLF